ncbi:ABC transporter ATP-binding protein [Lichenibacterium dinghuense]|uniref:ABC transporter ATP-binding protein n=1 Tax=Lichenibacterium dinghuense TaxID=2895977 RepID=UPI001F1C1328|nr:ABC transporter ATP-binding protein [Lichenibacterium sp. 6Y81]
MAAIALERVSKSFGRNPVLKDVSLEVGDGEFVALLGASGCGKSTLLRLIAGLDSQDSGEIRIDGRRMDDLPPAERDIAMVFQSYALYPHLTVEQNIASPLRVKRLNALERLPLIGAMVPSARRSRRQIRREVATVAATLGIEHLLDRRPEQLSGGQRQRVAIGRAVVRRPRAFLMDEPLSNLDAALRGQMRDELAQLHQRLGATIVYITHDQTEAMTMADRIAVMRSGEILQVGRPTEIYDDPAYLAVAELVGTPRINLLEGCLTPDGAVRVGRFTVPGAVQPALTAANAGRVTLGIRPEALAMVGPEATGWSGIVRRVEHLGSERTLLVDLDDTAGRLLVRSDPFMPSAPRAGERVHLATKPGRILLFGPDGARLPLSGSRAAQANAAA